MAAADRFRGSRPVHPAACRRGRDGPEQVTIQRNETAATRQRPPRRRHCPRRDPVGHSPS
jgi:hypothetical protein